MKSRFQPNQRIMQDMDTDFSAFFQSLHVDDRRFVASKTEGLPNAIRRILLKKYQQQTDRVAANIQLRTTRAKIDKNITPLLAQNFDADAADIKELAAKQAKMSRSIVLSCRRLRTPPGTCLNGSAVPVNGDVRNHPPLISVNGALRVCAEDDSVNDSSRNLEEMPEQTLEETELRQIYQKLCAWVAGFHLAPPEAKTIEQMRGAIKRIACASWWQRKLRKLLKKNTETVMVILGQVNKRTGIYVSEMTFRNRQKERQLQQSFLESAQIVNELSERFSLKEVSDKNISNPQIRRNELMTRARGFENIATAQGEIGVFVTLTCPSKYHSTYAKSGDFNPKWNGSTPWQGQQYLNDVWSRIRAELAREEIRFYGFRVAEPQHDGTPHWHLLLFLRPEQQQHFLQIFNHYALQEDGSEEGAAANRVKVVQIDPARGSATGYIAKYICKNIDGAGLDQDINGGDAAVAASRVEAWANCWGIRQFQQLGGVSVSVWRELRRLTETQEQPQIEATRQAADQGNWQQFVAAMGGVFAKRKEQLLRPYYSYEADAATGLIKTSWFDDLVLLKLKGIQGAGQTIITRLHQWRLELAAGRFSLSLGVL